MKRVTIEGRGEFVINESARELVVLLRRALFVGDVIPTDVYDVTGETPVKIRSDFIIAENSDMTRD
jgi:hypothetical protein